MTQWTSMGMKVSECDGGIRLLIFIPGLWVPLPGRGLGQMAPSGVAVCSWKMGTAFSDGCVEAMGLRP